MQLRFTVKSPLPVYYCISQWNVKNCKDYTKNPKVFQKFADIHVVS